MILDKEELTTAQNQLDAEQNQLIVCILVFEENIANMGELEARLERSEKEKMTHIQEAAQLHEEHKDLKSKWDGLQDIITVATERESASME